MSDKPTPFNLKISQLEPKTNKEGTANIVQNVLLRYENLNVIASNKHVLVKNLPLGAFRHKISLVGRFCYEDGTFVDSAKNTTLVEYLEEEQADYIPLLSELTTDFGDEPDDNQSKLDKKPENNKRHSFMLYWTEKKPGHSPNNQLDRARKLAKNQPTKTKNVQDEEPEPTVKPAIRESTKDDPDPEPDCDKEEQHKLPAEMDKTDWGSVFLANKILNCFSWSEMQEKFVRAPRAAFVLRSPQDDDQDEDGTENGKSSIPAWSYATSLSRTYIEETENCRSKSLVTNGLSNSSWNLGIGLAWEKLSLGGSFETSKEKSVGRSKVETQYEKAFKACHEIPIVQIDLHAGNVTIAQECHKALIQLRNKRNFSDLQRFFEAYGTMYAKSVTLGGRLIHTEQITDSTTSEENKQREKLTKNVGLSLGFADFATIEGGHGSSGGESKETGNKTTKKNKAMDWQIQGVGNFRCWRPIRSEETLPIEQFIGGLDGYDDIPGLFDSILRSGLSDPMILTLPSSPRAINSNSDATMTLGELQLGQGIDALTGKMASVGFETPREETLKRKVVLKGGTSWRVMSSVRAVKEEIAANLQTTFNSSVNIQAIPQYLQSLSVQANVISVVFKWSSDSVEYGEDDDGTQGQSPVIAQLLTAAKATCEKIKDLNAAKEIQPSLDEQTKAQLENVSKLLETLAHFPSMEQATDAQNNLQSISNTIKNMNIELDEEEIGKVDEEVKQLDATLSGEDKEKKKEEIKARSLELKKKNVLMRQNDLIDASKLFGSLAEFLRPPNFQFKESALKDVNAADKFIPKFGHYYISSFTEKATATVVWSLRMTTDKASSLEAFRGYVENYFHQPRSILEGFEFFLQKDFRKIDKEYPGVEVTSSVFLSDWATQSESTFRAPATLPSQVYDIVEKQRRNCNNIRAKATIKPYKTGLTKELGEELEKVMASIKATDKHVLLQAQEACRSLILLKLYKGAKTDCINKHLISIHEHVYSLLSKSSTEQKDVFEKLDRLSQEQMKNIAANEQVDPKCILCTNKLLSH